MTQPLIQLRDLYRTYRDGAREQRVLAGVSLDIDAGRSVALLGRSGSGKSTLLNLIAGIDLPDQGRVLVNGQDLPALSERRRTLFRRRHIGFIYQFFNLLPSLTARENVALALELNQWAPADIARRTAQLLGRLGLEPHADRFPSQLSGGEQQRVAMARALAHRPTVILADEPTGNLDAGAGRGVLAQLHELLEEQGGALVLVTHSLAVAQGADRVLTLEEGVLRERDSAFAW